MKKIKYTLRRTGSVYTFHVFTKGEFQESEPNILGDGKGYIFLLFKTEKEGVIENVEVLGAAVTKTKLTESINQLDFTHIAFIDYNGWNAKPTIDEYLILEFGPTEIWFLDESIKLVYTPMSF